MCYYFRMHSFSVVHLREVGSTNTYLRERCADTAHHSVVYADVQTSGRGRLGRSWDSSIVGNLYMSLLESDLAVLGSVAAENFTQLMAVCLIRTLADCSVQAGLKWPNDVFVGKAKIAGILSEARFQGGSPRAVIIGTGVNLHSAPVLDSDAVYEATSVRRESGLDQLPSPLKFLNSLLNHYTDIYPLFVREGFSCIRNEYEEHLLFKENDLFVEADGFTGRHNYGGLTDGGQLVLIDETGESHIIRTGEVRWQI